MKTVLVLCLAALAVAAAAPAAPQRPRRQNPYDAQILRYDYDNDGSGRYRYDFEQSDGTQHQQQGELRNVGRENEALVVTGRYSYIGADGVLYIVTYVADENGYQPEIEQGPGGAVPPEVLRSLLGDKDKQKKRS